jgi:acyl-CoA hydrolase
MWLDFGFGNSQPFLFDRVLAERVDELKGVKIRNCLPLRPIQCMENDPDGGTFWLGDWHQGSVSRKYVAEGRCNYIPMNFGEAPRYYREDLDVDIAVFTTTPMDRHGYFNFGTDITYSRATMEKAKVRVVEANESKPWVHGGYDECIHISEVDHVIENHEDRISEYPYGEPSKTDEKIAENIVEHVPLDGVTVQVGVGGLPNAVCRLIGETGKDIGVHTEMVTEAMFELAEMGVLTGRKKTFLPGKVVHTFAFGSRKLYDWMDRNPMLAGYPVDFTNDPSVAALNKNLIAINSALEVDLQGQVNAESIGTAEYTGTGGQLAFSRGGYYRSPRGVPPVGWPANKSFICLQSTYFDRQSDRERSKIVPTLSAGSIVTDPRTDTSYVATEWGVAYLKGKSIPERVLEMVKVAHPGFRDWLIQEAKKIGWLPKAWSG